jgi:dTDP-4-dehydrorhamnose 3,5-epimerase
MKIIDEPMPGVCLFSVAQSEDDRGRFVKTFEDLKFKKEKISFKLKEEFFSVSKKNVIRGMHFQVPPHDHAKIIYCISGSIIDVVLDLRVGPYYGRYAEFKLDSQQNLMLYVPRGLAHGFCSLEDNSTVVYKTDFEYIPTSDLGVRWNSFGYDWKIDNPILSNRDRQHINFKEFVSPFE